MTYLMKTWCQFNTNFFRKQSESMFLTHFIRPALVWCWYQKIKTYGKKRESFIDQYPLSTTVEHLSYNINKLKAAISKMDTMSRTPRVYANTKLLYHLKSNQCNLSHEQSKERPYGYFTKWRQKFFKKLNTNDYKKRQKSL